MIGQEMSLIDYVKEFGQQFVAEKLGVTQGSVSMMLSRERDIYVVHTGFGQITDCYEMRGIGRFKEPI